MKFHTREILELVSHLLLQSCPFSTAGDPLLSITQCYVTLLFLPPLAWLNNHESDKITDRARPNFVLSPIYRLQTNCMKSGLHCSSFWPRTAHQIRQGAVCLEANNHGSFYTFWGRIVEKFNSNNGKAVTENGYTSTAQHIYQWMSFMQKLGIYWWYITHLLRL